MNDSMRRLLDERWPSVRAEAQTRLAELRRTIVSAADVPGGLHDARNVAHQLRGRLGMYGHRDASALAGALEASLAAPPATDPAARAAFARDVVQLIDQLVPLLVEEPAVFPAR